MSELIITTGRRTHWQLLSTASALALLASAYVAGEAEATDNDADHPLVWIELGGQLEHTGGQGDPFAPAFLAKNPDSSVLQPTTPIQAQNPTPFGFGENGKITFQPEDSNWVFSLAANYGRSSNFKRVDHQTNRVLHAVDPLNTAETILTTVENFAETQAQRRQSHAIVDFSVGKDVGVGLFGKGSSSVLGLGVRFAQFMSKETFDIRARPDLKIKYFPSATATARLPIVTYNTYHAMGSASRSFHGIGPSLTWNGSVPFVGNSQEGEITFDWGANAAILFGRQKAHVAHQESATHHSGIDKYNTSVYHHPVNGHSIDRAVTVPNVGGFAGLTFRVENFKISAGYRADLFFGAVDGGIDAAKKENVGFYGPFASVSVGIGG
jgi:iron complex outermembrane receptor protein